MNKIIPLFVFFLSLSFLVICVIYVNKENQVVTAETVHQPVVISPVVVPDFEGEADPNVMTLDMHTWRWIETNYNNDTALLPKQEGDFTLTFKEDSSFSITTDCNSGFGSYEVNENQITFGENIGMTEMYCEGSQEQDFVKMLVEVTSFFFTTRGELIMELRYDTGSAIFR